MKYFSVLILILMFSCAKTKKEENLKLSENNSDTIIADSSKLKPASVNNFRNEIDFSEYVFLKDSPANGREMEKIRTDLDGDKKIDSAFILEKKESFSDYLLYIYLSGSSRNYTYKLIDNFDPDFKLFPTQLKIKNNVLELCYFRDGTAAFGRFLKFRYNSKANNIELIGYDSGYKRDVGQHLEKSFNLKNGNFTIKIQKPLPEIHIETYRGNHKMKPVFIQQIDVNMLTVLDKVGSEFETEDY